MMKTLKVGLLGLAMGALGAVALSSHEAQACMPINCVPTPPSAPANPSNPNKALACEMQYVACKVSANGNMMSLAICAAQRGICLSN